MDNPATTRRNQGGFWIRNFGNEKMGVVEAAKKEVYKGYLIEYFSQSSAWFFKIKCVYYGCEISSGSHRKFESAQSQAKFEVDIITT